MSQDLTMTKNGIDVSVRVNTVFGGRFEATVGDTNLDAPTWTALEKLVDKATKRVAQEVKIPFTRVTTRVSTDGDVIVKRAGGVATGLHSGNGNVLARIQDNPVQLSRFEMGQAEFCRPVTLDEATEYRRLLMAKYEADKAVRAWRRERAIDLADLVIKALNESASPAE